MPNSTNTDVGSGKGLNDPGASPEVQGTTTALDAAASEPSAAFTPGPWMLEDDDWGHRIIMGDAITSPYDHETHNLVTYEHGCLPGETSDEQVAQALANARLIAAAPDLYEALKVIADESVFSQQRFAEDDDADYFLRCFRAVKDRARAALAKAEGSTGNTAQPAQSVSPALGPHQPNPTGGSDAPNNGADL